MTYKQIETSREIRLWIGQVIVPAVAFTMAFPGPRGAVVKKINEVKESIKNRKSKDWANGSFFFIKGGIEWTRTFYFC